MATTGPDEYAPRWRRMWQDLRLTPPPVLEDVIAAYADPSRHYHSIEHLADCLGCFDEVRGMAERPGEVELAIWFHDAIYDSAGHDNEALSAEWARQVILDAGGSEEMAGRVGALIRATDHRAPPGSGDAGLLCDIDLSILGAPHDRFERYERQVRAEYGWVPDRQYREGRAAILRRFLARPRVYATDVFSRRFEDQTKDNLIRSLARLEQGGS